jgi:hypothetical protein
MERSNVVESEEIYIGHYILGKTLGKGSFEKVKCRFLLNQRPSTI